MTAWIDAQPVPAAELIPILTQITASLRANALFDAACGPRGLRRFVARFQRQGARFRLRGLESERLPSGGPPDPRAWEQAIPRAEQLIERFAQALPEGCTFDRAAVGVVRDDPAPGLDPWPHLSIRFDADADRYALPEVRMPKGEGLAVEDAAYLRALESWTPRVHAARARWITPSPGERWEITNGRLRLTGVLERSLRATALATWVPRTGDFTWLLDEPAGPEAPFRRAELVLELGPALELVSFAAARLQATGVFQGGLDHPPDVQVFAAVRE